MALPAGKGTIIVMGFCGHFGKLSPILRVRGKHEPCQKDNGRSNQMMHDLASHKQAWPRRPGFDFADDISPLTALRSFFINAIRSSTPASPPIPSIARRVVARRWFSIRIEARSRSRASAASTKALCSAETSRLGRYL